MADEIQPSTSALLYLGADVLLSTGGKFTGVRVPCRGVKVPQKDLASLLVAAELLEHRAAGALTLERVEKKVLFRKVERLAVHVTGGAGAPGWGASLVAAARNGDDVRELVRRWFERDVTNPYVHVVGHVDAELVDAGLMAGKDEGGVRGTAGRLLRGKADVEPDCERIAALAPAIAAAAARWRQWQADDAALVTLLVDECRAAITSREQDAG